MQDSKAHPLHTIHDLWMITTPETDFRHVFLERENIFFISGADRSWYVEVTQAIWPQTDRLAAKLEEVTRIMNTLSSDLQKINLLPHRKHTQLRL